MTLAAILQGLFGIDNVAPELLSYIGNEMHRLTVGKKQFDAAAANPNLLPQDLQRAADRLMDKLHDLFTEAKESSQLARRLLCSVSGSPNDSNPLNLVIPAFEAPWRATYYTLLATLQSGPTRPANLVTLRDCVPHLQPPPAALAVAYESLRVYPPEIAGFRVSRQEVGSQDIMSLETSYQDISVTISLPPSGVIMLSHYVY